MGLIRRLRLKIWPPTCHYCKVNKITSLWTINGEPTCDTCFNKYFTDTDFKLKAITAGGVRTENPFLEL